MLAITKDEMLPITHFTKNNTTSRSAIYVGGTGSVDLMFTDPEGTEFTVASYAPGDHDVINHGIDSFLVLRLSGGTEGAPLFISVKGIE